MLNGHTAKALLYSIDSLCYSFLRFISCSIDPHIGMDKFDKDVLEIITRIVDRYGYGTYDKLMAIYRKLCKLHEENAVKINHSIMEVVCANQLLMMGYEVDVEYRLDEVLVCDIYGVKGDSDVIVEIETGFVPPDHALDPNTYLFARIISKIARYSAFANKFIIGTPPHNILQIPKAFLKPPRHRTQEELLYLKSICDAYYTKPPIDIELILNARLHSVYIIDVDNVVVYEVSPIEYCEIYPQDIKIGMRSHLSG